MTMPSRQSKPEEVVMAGDGGRVPDVSEQRADHEAGLRAVSELPDHDERAAMAAEERVVVTWPQQNIVREQHLRVVARTAAVEAIRVLKQSPQVDPASVLAALLSESPEATVAAIEALLTREAPLRAAAHVLYEAPPEADVARVWDVALSAACRSLLSKAPKEDGDA